MAGLGVEDLRNSYPQEIVDIFEKHGFIWGGKWSHFDLMHFEYRPELLRKWQLACEARPSRVKIKVMKNQSAFAGRRHLSCGVGTRIPMFGRVEVVEAHF